MSVSVRQPSALSIHMVLVGKAYLEHHNQIMSEVQAGDLDLHFWQQ